MAVELGRPWSVRHGHLRFARLVGSGGAAMYKRDARARRQALQTAKLRHSLGLHNRGNCAVRRPDSTTKEDGI